MSSSSLICDTSLLLYLGRIQQLHLLSSLYPQVMVPEQVAAELDVGRLLRSDTVNPRHLDFIRVEIVPQSSLDRLPANRLGNGERAVIALVRGAGNATAGLDDRQARQLALSLGLQVTGIVGILIEAKRSQLIPSLRPTLEAVQHAGFYLSSATFAAALRLAGE